MLFLRGKEGRKEIARGGQRATYSNFPLQEVSVENRTIYNGKTKQMKTKTIKQGRQYISYLGK